MSPTAAIRVLCASVLVGVVALAAAPRTQASADFLTGIVEANHVASDPAVRDRWFDETVNARADIFRITVSWRAVAPSQPAAPRDPADPAYRFDQIDAAIREGAERGLEPLVIVYNAPDWAEGVNRPEWAQPGSWKPDPGAFEDFATALGSRYSGDFVATGGVLPKVDFFQVWSEPNLALYLSPQLERGRRFAVEHYRMLLNSFRDGVRATNSTAKVVAPGTSPFGSDPPATDSIRPLVFLRDLLCVSRKGKAQPGKCPQPAQIDVVAHHPINVFAGPWYHAKDPDDATVGDFSSIVKLVRAAERGGTIEPRGDRPLWATELWWESNPPVDDDSFGVRPEKQARWLAEAFYSLWNQGAQAVVWFELVDPPERPGHGQLETGLFFGDGTPKPAFEAFRFPFVVRAPKGNATKSKVWSLPPSAGTLAIERRTGDGWKTIERHEVKGRPVPFETTVRVRGSKPLRAQLNGEATLPMAASARGSR